MYGFLVGLGLALHPLPAAADGAAACKPQKILRYINVEVAVTPPGGAAGVEVTLTAECLPPDRPAIILGGQILDAVRPVGRGSTDSGGNFEAAAAVPADAVPGEDYFFAIMIDDHAVGTGTFLVDGPLEPVPQ